MLLESPCLSSSLDFLYTSREFAFIGDFLYSLGLFYSCPYEAPLYLDYLFYVSLLMRSTSLSRIDAQLALGTRTNSAVGRVSRGGGSLLVKS